MSNTPANATIASFVDSPQCIKGQHERLNLTFEGEINEKDAIDWTFRLSFSDNYNKKSNEQKTLKNLTFLF